VYRCLIFDLDGTIVDSLPGITKSVNYALESCGLPRHQDDQSLSWFVGPPLREGFEGLTKTDDALLIDKLILAYRQSYRDVALESRLYPGIAELLVDVSGAKTLALATSKMTSTAERILRHHKLDHLFGVIVGSDPDGALSSKEESIGRVVDSIGGAGSDYLFIGDRGADVIGARKNGVDSVGVLYGYGTAREIEDARPRFVAKTVADLRGILLAM